MSISVDFLASENAGSTFTRPVGTMAATRYRLPKDRVLRGVLVSVDTVGLENAIQPAAKILQASDRFEMVGVATRPVATEVVKVHPLGDRANECFPDDAMGCLGLTVSTTKLAIPSSQRASPLKASIVSDLDLHG